MNARASVVSSSTKDDVGYATFLGNLQKRFNANTANGSPLFTTDAEGLFDAYLNAMPKLRRQHYTCHACRHFVERFGNLVTIAPDGSTAPALWDEADAPKPYKAAVAAMAKLVRRAKVTGVFLSSDKVYGQPVTGVWAHMAVTPSKAAIFHRLTQTPFQAAAEKSEDYRNVSRALAEFTPPMLAQALTLLRSEALYRSEKVLGQAEWLAGLHTARDAALGSRRNNVTWLAVATAPAGFCHPRSSMIGTLLDDIANGLPFADVSRKFAEKMHPLQYRRPTAAPAAGNIAQAEKIIEQMGLANALRRRYARVSDIVWIWEPAAAKAVEKAGGVFSHLKPKDSTPEPIAANTMPALTVTWVKFFANVLRGAERIELYVPSRGNFCGLVTAADPDAPPILQWDTAEYRNPVSWYLYNNGSAASQWGLRAGSWAPLTHITRGPPEWSAELGGGSFAHQAEHALFVIDGAKDTRNDELALFPETLKAELHAIRSVIEAHSKSERIEDDGGPVVAGVKITKGSPCDVILRVTSNGQRIDYRIDRWD